MEEIAAIILIFLVGMGAGISAEAPRNKDNDLKCIELMKDKPPSDIKLVCGSH